MSSKRIIISIGSNEIREIKNIGDSDLDDLLGYLAEQELECNIANESFAYCFVTEADLNQIFKEFYGDKKQGGYNEV